VVSSLERFVNRCTTYRNRLDDDGTAPAMGAGVRPNTGVDFAFSAPARMLTGLDVWITTLGYGFQLFFNFCGYSHLVIGAARLFGFRLAENFNRPYLSTTTSEFWTRWHMSLSFWIRDYVFFSIGNLAAGNVVEASLTGHRHVRVWTLAQG
jgi:hypothetical protein